MHAWVCPGQGSQFVGMGKALSESFPLVQEVYQEVDDALGLDLSGLAFAGDPAELQLTENVQPALFTLSVALSRLIVSEAGAGDISDLCDAVAGHSLGEYSALCCAGAMSLADGARVLKARGAAMQAAVPVGEGGMVAVLGLEMDALAALVADIHRPDAPCEIANDNAPGQIVVSGSAPAMEAVVASARAAGAKRALPLPVSAPFHSSMMTKAGEAMVAQLDQLELGAPVVPCYANTDGLPSQDVETIRSKLKAQICAPVRWRQSVARMAADGITDFVEIGAGKVLTGLVKRIAPEAGARAIGTREDIEGFLEECG